MAVAGGEIVERRYDIAETDTRRWDLARAIDAAGNQQGIMLLPQFRQGRVLAHLEVQMELNLAVPQQLGAPLDDFLLQLEVGNAIDHQAADAVIAVIDMHLVALAAELLGCGQAGGPGANDADASR